MAFMRVVPYAIGCVLPPLVVWSPGMSGVWTWLPVVVMFAGVPLADALMRQNILHPSAEEIIELEQRLVSGRDVALGARVCGAGDLGGGHSLDLADGLVARRVGAFTGSPGRGD